MTQTTNLADFWGTNWPYRPEPPLASDDVRRWETEHRLLLPATLAAALQIQNGGLVQGTRIRIFPLSRIVTGSEEQWEEISGPDASDSDLARLVLFGDIQQFPCSLILDYNVGPEPRVLHLWNGLGGELRDEGAGSLDEFLVKSRSD